MENSTNHSCSVPRVLKKIGYGAGLVIGVLLATLAGHYLFALATGTTFNETQWAAAGAWFGGIMTFGAVSVAVWQTKRARDDAANAKREANSRLLMETARHASELEAAEKRLTQELDAQRRHHELMSISPIWKAVSNLSKLTDELCEEIIEFSKLKQRKHRASAAITSEDVKPLTETTLTWGVELGQFDTSFDEAFMLLTEPETSKLLEELYVKSRVFQKTTLELSQEILKKGVMHVDTDPIKVQLGEILQMRRRIIKCARVNINNAPWLDLSLNGENPYGTS